MAKLQAFVTLIYALIRQAQSLQTTTIAPAVPCENLTLPSLPGLEISSVQGLTAHNYTNPLAPGVPLDICNVKVSYNHPGENDITWVNIWLPLNNWNGRFQATGGGGLAAGFGDYYLLGAAPFGYATGTTDGGLTLNNTIDPQTGQWALAKNGTLNQSLVKNFAHRAIHDMTVIGKSLTQKFYGKSSTYSYYTGCSTGGRQGYFAAQVYPADFDGIMANAPALNSPKISPGDFWPSVVMHNLGAPPQCVLDAYYNATLEYCDPLDGATDGLISNLGTCDFDPQSLVGKKVDCGGQNVTISTTFADVVSRIWAGSTSTFGASLFPGNPRGANFSGLANTTTTNGVTVPVPFSAAEAWIKYLVVHDPNYPTRNMSFADFDSVFGQSVVEFSGILGTMSPDLSQFQKRGGKLLTWHGLADQLITPYSTMLYRSALSREMALTQSQLNDFHRVFFAPGVSHCGGGIGPVPTDPLAALVSWVESRKVPDTLPAAIPTSPSSNITRNLCPYPQLLTYDGNGDVNDANSFSCT
ncbi:uncharacterized protein Z520_06535 [Fonsecaea multimorphosa CBS 102226]|uniref:Carboxylic ester hydrolase n=1 Tax=Fonsecaea multimorphosa CBS 102226 TaxID=1442371 RepID=A0A0D2JW71_9EURO|nr:uncharacterized protein Z520_06535 [Fonsecaea multimorphosa CBS 102226]KIX97757.1 hypothetical protein Z520_06535 [Fonsecaea multimorphosa CBS 102226]OAL23777.1 hypothetical protein AYO22_06096 [Fonsecaea multimorphosa]